MNTSSASPLISIGMPVRNEARFLKAALDSMLAQSNVRFELVISDNASTDSTADICHEFAARYPQLIRYHRFETNVGASANFAWVLEQATGDYFMWASGHDLWDSNYLYECSQAFAIHSQAVIAFGTTRWIDAEGQPYSRITGWSDTRGLSVIGRYFTVFWGNMNPIIGMIRTQNLKQQKFNDMVGVDLAILLALALQGDFLHCTGTSWCRREFRHEVSYKEKLKRYSSADYALSTSFMGKYFPLARLPLRIISDLFDSQTSLGLKLKIGWILLCSLPVKYLTDKAKKQQDLDNQKKTDS